MRAQCAEAANAPLVVAFQELSKLYFADGNRNAGASYNKVVAAIQNINFVITVDNALKLGKAGKSKVDGIGKSSAEKIKEFLETGTMAKLEEKRG